ncbi:MAG: hypothetical protein N2691_05265 [Patescibacteria group bacterium]|nr:hypothetical protein [Patescibacteria group bacterium]
MANSEFDNSGFSGESNDPGKRENLHGQIADLLRSVVLYRDGLIREIYQLDVVWMTRATEDGCLLDVEFYYKFVHEGPVQNLAPRGLTVHRYPKEQTNFPSREVLVDIDDKGYVVEASFFAHDAPFAEQEPVISAASETILPTGDIAYSYTLRRSLSGKPASVTVTGLRFQGTDGSLVSRVTGIEVGVGPILPGEQPVHPRRYMLTEEHIPGISIQDGDVSITTYTLPNGEKLLVVARTGDSWQVAPSQTPYQTARDEELRRVIAEAMLLAPQFDRKPNSLDAWFWHAEKPRQEIAHYRASLLKVDHTIHPN